MKEKIKKIYLILGIPLLILIITVLTIWISKQINWEFLITIGLGLNLLGTFILAFPVLRLKRWLEDEEIDRSGTNSKGKFWTETKGFRKIRYFAIKGLILLFFGFVFQIVALFLK